MNAAATRREVRGCGYRSPPRAAVPHQGEQGTRPRGGPARGDGLFVRTPAGDADQRAPRRRRCGHQPALRTRSPTNAMPIATAPKISCNRLKPRKGIWISNSVANNALAIRTAGGAHSERRQASQAAKPDGAATLSNNHPAGSAKLDSPRELSAETGGVATPARSWILPASPPKPTRLSTETMVRRNGKVVLMVRASSVALASSGMVC